MHPKNEMKKVFGSLVDSSLTYYNFQALSICEKKFRGLIMLFICVAFEAEVGMFVYIIVIYSRPRTLEAVFIETHDQVLIFGQFLKLRK